MLRCKRSHETQYPIGHLVHALFVGQRLSSLGRESARCCDVLSCLHDQHQLLSCGRRLASPDAALATVRSSVWILSLGPGSDEGRTALGELNNGRPVELLHES